MCGKNIFLSVLEICFAGSPPRVREKLGFKPDSKGGYGITPACAGKTSRLIRSDCALRDHPRVCGKNVICLVFSSVSIGSPPRVREKLTIATYKGLCLGITPACAGKTQIFRPSECLPRDHPRVCGKNAIVAPFFACAPGSPPRVREKLGYRHARHYPSRITPACAGKTTKSKTHYWWREDHPRVCGKNPYKKYYSGASTGSPPRVREKLAKIAPLSVNGGITPACAGKTDKRAIRGIVAGDHPRVCGKNICKLKKELRNLGSPPRVREKRAFLVRIGYIFRITPACAGKTSPSTSGVVKWQDHPRVCGKNTKRSQ